MSVRATRWPRAAATVAALLAVVVALVGCTADVDVTVNADGKVDTSLDVRIDADDPNKDLIKELAAGLGQATGAGSNGECTDSTADGVVVIACTTPPFDADIPADETAGIRVTEEDGRVLLRLWSDEEVDGGGWFDASAVTTNLTITMPGEIDVAEMNGNALDTQGDTVTVSMTGVEPFDVVVTTAATDTPRVTSPADRDPDSGATDSEAATGTDTRAENASDDAADASASPHIGLSLLYMGLVLAGAFAVITVAQRVRHRLRRNSRHRSSSH